MKETSLDKHTLHRKKLITPLNELNFTKSSWINTRLPEFIWLALVISNIQREKALEFFRYVALYVEENPTFYDISLTGISKLTKEDRSKFIKYISDYSKDINKLLQFLTLFPELPAREEWVKVLGTIDAKADISPLVIAVDKTLGHQTQEATECRWAIVLCAILGGKLNFTSSRFKGTVEGILGYPDSSTLERVRSSIRVAEMALRISVEGQEPEWSNKFWKYCFEHTKCISEDKLSKRQDTLIEEMKNLDNVRDYYYDKTLEIRTLLLNHLITTRLDSSIDAKHESIFGIAVFALNIFIEMSFYNFSMSINSRLAVRAMLEAYITLSYLIIKEKSNSSIWEEYRVYGTGQYKLTLLKLRELSQSKKIINQKELSLIANEDQWIEFTNINFGHWDNLSLRKMADEAGLKDLYDTFYSYTSAFMHGNWGAVRESVYEKCINPLHRLHRYPKSDLALFTSATEDSEYLINKILDCIDEIYPSFKERFNYSSKKS